MALGEGLLLHALLTLTLSVPLSPPASRLTPADRSRLARWAAAHPDECRLPLLTPVERARLLFVRFRAQAGRCDEWDGGIELLSAGLT